MSKVIENYVLMDVIGSGQYGKVYKAKHMKTEQIVAIKVVKLEKFREIPKLHEFTINEIQTLSKIENPNVVRFIEMLKTSNNMYLVYEFCNGDTLEALIQKRKYLTEPETMKIFAQMLNAFRSLSKENILHRDLKPSNILFHDGIVKIADFGFCKSLLSNTDLTQTMVGSPIYMAPEVLKGCSYNTRADVWSLGVVLYECLFGFCPFEDKSIARLIMQIDNKELQFQKNVNNISKKCEDLLRSMLQVDHRKRVDWPQLLQITFYEDPSNNLQTNMIPPNSGTSQVRSINQPLLKKQSSSNLNNQPINTLVDKTNAYVNSVQQNQNQQFTDEKTNQNYLRKLILERSKVVFLTSILSLVLEQNTIGSTQNNGNQLTFSQKTALLAYFLMKQVNLQTESLKRMLDIGSTLIDRIEDFQQTNEFKIFSQTFARESDIIQSSFESFKGEAQRILRTIKQGDQVTQFKNELSSRLLDQRLFQTLCVSYCEEVLQERIPSLSEDQQKKSLLLLNDLLESPTVNEFFDKNVTDTNLKFNDQKYFDTMRRMNRDTLEDLLRQKSNTIKFRHQK